MNIELALIMFIPPLGILIPLDILIPLAITILIICCIACIHMAIHDNHISKHGRTPKN